MNETFVLKNESNRVSILPLKKVIRGFPKDSSLRELILREPDKLDSQEFDAKAKTWLSLLEIESQKLGVGVGAPTASEKDSRRSDANYIESEATDS